MAPDRPQARRSRISRMLLVASPVPLWLLLTYVLCAPLLHDLSGPLPGGADSLLYSWYFKEIQVSLWHGENPFFTTAMNAPTGLNVMWNTAIILPAFLMSPVTAAFGATTSIAVLMIAAPLAAAGVCYWVLFRMTGHVWGAAAGATLFGFGPFFNGQQGHVHLTLGSVFLPLILYFGFRLFSSTEQSPRALGWRLGATVGVTMLISEEVVAIAGTVAGLSVLALILRNRNEVRVHRRRVLLCLAWAAGVALVICGPALGYQFFGPLPVTSGIHSSIALDLVSAVRPGSTMFFSTNANIAANHQFIANGAENTGYLGWLLILVTVLACVVLFRSGRQRLGYWLSTTAGLAFALSLGTTVRVNGLQTFVPMPWLFLSRVPVLETLVPARFSVATILLVATILAYGIAALPAIARSTRRPALAPLGYVFVAAALILCWPAAGGKSANQVVTPQFFSTTAVNAIAPGDIVLALPQPNTPDGATTVMKWQIDAGMRFDIIGGYSFFSRDGKPHYDAQAPFYAGALQRVGESGIAMTVEQVAQARESVLTSVGGYVVVTDQVAQVRPVLAALKSIAGCTPDKVSDVYLCKIER